MISNDASIHRYPKLEITSVQSESLMPFFFLFFSFCLDTERGSETLTQLRKPQRCNVVTANACVERSLVIKKKKLQVLPDSLMDVFCFWNLLLLSGRFQPLGKPVCCSPRPRLLAPLSITSVTLSRCLHGCHDVSAFTSTRNYCCPFALLISSLGELRSALIKQGLYTGDVPW